MSKLTPEIPFIASLWIRSGCDMKVEPSVETYQVGAHFKALTKAILVAPSRTLEKFFSFHVSLPRCAEVTKVVKSTLTCRITDAGRLRFISSKVLRVGMIPSESLAFFS